MDITGFAIFFAASWVLILTPGPDMLYVITRGISHGPRAGVISTIGVTLGILVHTAAAAFGLAMILKTSAMAFLLVKYAGAIYLIFLGIKSFKNRTDLTVDGQSEPVGTRTIFVQGMLTNVLNPKIALFFLAFLPQFVSPANGSVPLQMAALGLTFALFGIIFLMLIGYFSGGIGAWLSRNRYWAQRIRWVTGSILIAMGLRLACIARR